MILVSTVEAKSATALALDCLSCCIIRSLDDIAATLLRAPLDSPVLLCEMLAVPVLVLLKIFGLVAAILWWDADELEED